MSNCKIQGGPAEINVMQGNTDIQVNSEYNEFRVLLSSGQPNYKEIEFTVENTGNEVLHLTGSPIVEISGDPEFSLVNQPATVINPGQSSTFSIRFTTNTVNLVQGAAITIENDDSNENPFIFQVHGNAVKGIGYDLTDISSLYGTNMALWGNHILVTGDFNGDGRTDIIMQSPSVDGYSYMLTADASGGFVMTNISNLYGTTMDLWGSRKLVTGDFNGDGRTDIIFQSPRYNWPSYMLIADGSGGFATKIDINNLWGTSMALWGYRILVTGDFNGDGRTDIIMQSPSVDGYSYMLTADASGGFVMTNISNLYGTTMDLWGSRKLVTGDFNGDGRTDIIFQSPRYNWPSYMLIADGSGGFATKIDINNLWGTSMALWGYRILVTGDFNGDGRTDIIMQCPNVDGYSYMLTADASGGFIMTNISNLYGTTMGLWGSRKLVTGDFNGDGRTDIIFQSPRYNWPSYMLIADASGGFVDKVDINTLWGTSMALWGNRRLLSGDFNGDHCIDIIMQSPGVNGSTFMLTAD